MRAPKPTVTASKLGVAVGQVERVGPAELDRDAALAALSPRQLEHRLGEVAADDAAVGADPLAQLEGQVAGAAADVEGVEPGPTRAMSTARSRQRWCSPAVIAEFIVS